MEMFTNGRRSSSSFLPIIYIALSATLRIIFKASKLRSKSPDIFPSMACSSCPISSLLPLFIVCLHFIIFDRVASSYVNPFTWMECPSDSNFTLNSTYQSNLNHVFAALPTSGYQTGFALASYGVAPDQVFGRALCRGDLSPSKCQSCLATAAQGVATRCPTGKRAIIFYDKCFLRYSDTNSTTTEEKEWEQILYNSGTISDAQPFEKLYKNFMDGLTDKAANSSRKFALGQTNFTSAITMYGLAECMRDLSVEECHTCLNQSIGYFQSCCKDNQGGVVLRYQCYIRMEIYQYFMNSSAEEPSAAPSLSPQSVPYSSTIPSSKENTGSQSKRKTVLLVIMTSLCGFVILMVAATFAIWRRRKSMRQKAAGTHNEDKESTTPLLFKLQTLRIATNDFSSSNKLGEGGFGSVYKGCLPNGHEIAVKRLSVGSRQGVSELKNEVVALANLQHKNLVKLLGLCLDEQEKILVYEFLPNKSLDTFFSDLEKSKKLNWQIRYQIIEGVARGLLYLHEESRIRIIHRDLKTSNILLDDNMLPKISDFGLAKLFDIDKSSQGTASRIVGTNGYIAPECFMRRHISTKSDVFSYGVIVLEILTGRSVGEFNGSGSTPNLISLVWKEWCNGEALQVIDQRLQDAYPVNEAFKCLNIALLCVQDNPSKRPNMTSVALMLTSNSISTPKPSTPAYFLQGTSSTKTEVEDCDRQSHAETDQLSVNDLTITEMDPR